jgi:hypothetical protein
MRSTILGRTKVNAGAPFVVGGAMAVEIDDAQRNS